MKLRRQLGQNDSRDNAALWKGAGVGSLRDGAVFVSGYNGAASHLMSRPDGIGDQLDLTLPTVERGYTVFSPPSGTGWGNATSLDWVSDVIDYAQANLGVPDGPVHYYGQSHGGIIGLKCLMNSTMRQRIRSMVVAITPNDIQAMYSENRGGLAASISSAYGGAPSDADNPADNTAVIKASGVPLLYIYSGADSFVTLAEHEAFIEGAECQSVYMGDEVGHALSFDYGLIGAWFAQHEERFHG